MSTMRPDFFDSSFVGIGTGYSFRLHARGFAMLSAIFLLAVLAALGAFMLTFSTTQQASSAQDVMGSRAYQAARAGIERAAFQVTTTGTCASTSLTGLAGDLASFTVSVACGAPQTYTEGAATVTVYTVTSTASTGAAVGSIGYVERRIKVTVSRTVGG